MFDYNQLFCFLQIMSVANDAAPEWPGNATCNKSVKYNSVPVNDINIITNL